MAEHCPLNDLSMSTYIPEECRETCEDIWSAAVSGHEVSGDYDVYEDHGPEGLLAEADPCTDGEAEFSHATLTAVSAHDREYTIVDQCGEGHEIGEQGFRFRCPLSLQPDDYGTV